MTQNSFADKRVSEVSQKVLQAAKDTLGEKLDKVILFGSYARGDYEEDSDIDFLIVAHGSQEEASIAGMDISKRLPGIDLEYDITVSLHVTVSPVFNKYAGTLPFYRNVMSEGVLLSG